MAQIFLSYNRADQLPASNLAKDLKELGHTVWLDQDLSGGQAWWDQILARIRASDLFVFVLSSASLYSTACQREYGYAAELRRPILPVLVRNGLSTNVLPPALSQVQFLDFRERHIDAIIALARSLQSLPTGVPLPDPLPAPPEVPLSYLANLSQQIESPATLSVAEQSRLVLELKSGLRDPTTHQDARALWARLRAHRDLLATIAEEMDEVLSAKTNRKRTVSWLQPRSMTDTAERNPSPAFVETTREISAGGTNARPLLIPWWATKDPSKLRRVAGQRIWKHWLLALGPALTFMLLGGATNSGNALGFALAFTLITAILSVISLRNPIPIITTILSVVPFCNFITALLDSHHIIIGATILFGAPILFFSFTFFCFDILLGSLSQLVIQQARKQLAIPS